MHAYTCTHTQNWPIIPHLSFLNLNIWLSFSLYLHLSGFVCHIMYDSGYIYCALWGWQKKTYISASFPPDTKLKGKKFSINYFSWRKYYFHSTPFQYSSATVIRIAFFTILDKKNPLMNHLAPQKAHGMPESFLLCFWKNKALTNNWRNERLDCPILKGLDFVSLWEKKKSRMMQTGSKCCCRE